MHDFARNKTEISGHSDLAATECALPGGGARFALPSLGHGGDGRCRVGSTFWLGDHSPEIAKPAGEAGRAYRLGPGKVMSGKQVFPHLSVFCK